MGGAQEQDWNGWVDIATEHEISGWAAPPAGSEEPAFVDIVINARRVATVAACVLRQDLADLGFSDGRSGFHFCPIAYLDRLENMVEIFYAGTAERLPNGRATIVNLRHATTGPPPDRALRDRIAEMSKERWRDNERAEGLTWGRRMTGDSFIEAVSRYRPLRKSTRICELGPGYGRLLRTVLARGLPFESFVGLELSEGRVRALNREFGADPRICFRAADINHFRLDQPVDLVICSSTFEHLYPDCGAALRNIADNLRGDGRLGIDFILRNSDPTWSGQWFEEPSHAFIRVYSSQEIEQLLGAAGFEEIQLERIALGEGEWGKVERIFASARKRKISAGR